MRTLAQNVLAYVRKHRLLRAGDRVGAAVSGGADSVAMLRLLLDLRQEMGIILGVVHFNHQLRGVESDGDQDFVAELAQRNQLPFHCESGDVTRHAAEKRLSIETGARELRYAYFRRLLGEGGMNRIATAHTLDDQAETVLMRVARGAGTRGLAGVYPQLAVAGSRLNGSAASEAIVRPLLGTRRRDLESYLKNLGQEWREDASNLDLCHLRNRARHEVLPRLESSLNPAVREALAETAEIARAEEEYWQGEVEPLLASLWNDGERSLRVGALGKLPLALRRRVIRAAAESVGLRLDFEQVEEALEVGSGGAKSAEMPWGWRIRRRNEEMLFERSASGDSAQGNPAKTDYEYRLPVPGEISIPEAGIRLDARLIPGDGAGDSDGGILLDADATGSELVARNWRAGERFWPAHTKAPKKIKELLLEMHVTGPERGFWPVVAKGNEVVWVRGLLTPGDWRPKAGAKEVLRIRARPLSPGEKGGQGGI